MGSIRVVLGLAASLDLEVEQMDVNTAFLHGDLDKEIYMEQHEGFQVKGKEDYVCRLQKSLYGLKQAPRQWYKKFESVIRKQGFRKTSSRIVQLKRDLSKSFAMKDLGPAIQILGIRIFRDRDDIQNDEEQGADDVDAEEQPNLDEDVHPELPVPMPPFVYKLKTEVHTFRPRYKARLVVKGFSQKRCIDFDEIFFLVVKIGSIRVVLGLAASLDLKVEQMDVKTDFLHGDLDKEIYMEQPEGFQVKGKEEYVCRLQKSLYGLKQAPRQWFGDDDFIILLLYVDDMLIVGKNIERIAQLKRDLSKSFAMKDLGRQYRSLAFEFSAIEVPRSCIYHKSNTLRRFCAGSTWIKLK
nr:retrovirus-related Pol polyprotein from transposon TNT 1-94 [Tanacetum cinerariifolium]